MAWFYILVFIISSFILVLTAKKIIDCLDNIARFLGWKEFVVAFFTVSFGAVAPEFFIGVSSAIRGIPELSFGNILGQNILLFSFTVAICAIILKKGIEVESKTVRIGCTFAVVAAILPLLLIWDGVLSRIDGAILLSFFIFFIFWLFSKKERFTKIYDGTEEDEKGNKVSCFLRDMGTLVMGFFIIILSAQGIIWSAEGFSEILTVSLPFIGLLIVAAGVGLPETYFALMLAKKGQSWMIIGGLMGAVAISSTLVMGTVSLIRPIHIDIGGEPSLIVARIFLIICALLFLFFARSRSHISTKEGIFLLLIYITFIVIEILIR
jgi:cation:H+ antiporter